MFRARNMLQKQANSLYLTQRISGFGPNGPKPEIRHWPQRGLFQALWGQWLARAGNL